MRPHAIRRMAGTSFSITSTVGILGRSEEHTSELQSPCNLVCRLLLEKKKTRQATSQYPPTDRNRSRLSSRAAAHRRSPLHHRTHPAPSHTFRPVATMHESLYSLRTPR